MLCFPNPMPRKENTAYWTPQVSVVIVLLSARTLYVHVRVVVDDRHPFWCVQ